MSFVLGIIPVGTHPKVLGWPTEKALFSAQLLLRDG